MVNKANASNQWLYMYKSYSYLFLWKVHHNGYICTTLTPTFFSGKYVTTPDQPSHLHHLNTSQIYNVEICEVYLLVGILGNILVLVNIKMHAW